MGTVRALRSGPTLHRTTDRTADDDGDGVPGSPRPHLGGVHDRAVADGGLAVQGASQERMGAAHRAGPASAHEFRVGTR